jgi:UDP-glucose 6-dehydrogenase
MPIDISIASDNMNKKHLHFQVSEFVKNNGKINKVRVENVSFKPGSDIIEESQKLEFAVKLSEKGYAVTIVDTEDVINSVKEKYGNMFSYEKSNNKLA